MNLEQRKLLLYSGLGGLLEFYDFIIYALLAAVLAEQFFPSTDKLTGLLVTFSTFSLGYLVRPIGGIVFSHFGDKYGRKNTFMTTIILMASSTFAIAFIPSYHSIGITATILLISMRILQGLSVGGEIPGAITYISESIPERRTFATAIIFFFILNGITLGSFFHYLVVSQLTHAQLLSWGWRCLFFAGGVFGFFGLFLRRKMVESPLYIECEDISRIPFLDVLRNTGINVILTTLIVGLGASYITVLYLFLPAYFKSVLHFVPSHFLLVFTFAIFIGSLVTLLFGWIAEKTNKSFWLALFAFLGTLTSMSIFKAYVLHQYIYAFLIFSCMLIGATFAVVPSLIAEFFPTRIRYSGVASSYNLAFAIFGGLSPVVCLFMIKWTGKLYSPAYYLIALSSVVLILAVWLGVRQSRGESVPNKYF